MNETENLVKVLLVELRPFIYLLLLLLIVWAAKRIAGLEFFEILSKAWKEIRDFVARKKSVSSVNLLGFLTTLVFGVVIVIAMEFEKMLTFFAGAIGPANAQTYRKSSDFPTLLIVAGFVFIVSLLAVVADEWDERRRK